MSKAVQAICWLTVLSFAGCRGGGGGSSAKIENVTSPGPEPDNPVPSAASLPEVGLCASEKLEVYENSVAEGWAKVRCSTGEFCLDWAQCKTVSADGLTYLVFSIPEEEIGGYLRYNDNPSYSAVLVIHKGAGGTQWVEGARDIPGDSTDWQSLQDDFGIRVVSVRWFDTGIDYGFPAGRFTRKSTEAATLGEMSRRPAALIQWIDQNLNPEGKPLGVVGSSGGADAVLGPFLVGAPIADSIDYLGLVSYAPFNDIVAGCNFVTPLGSFVDPDTGSLGATGAAAGVGYGQPFFDGLLQTTACATEAMTPEIAEGSNSTEILDALLADGGNPFAAVLHATVATGPPSDDNVIGVTWALGNLYNHDYFAPATRIWDNCSTQGHGTPLTNPALPCFDRIYAEVIAALLP